MGSQASRTNDSSNSTNDPSNSPSGKSKTFVFWNINVTGNKNSKLYHEDVHNLLFHKHDIIILTETHAKKYTSFEDIPLFTYFNFHRTFVHKKSCWPSGGIGIFVWDAITDGISIYMYSTDECIVWIKISSIFFKLLRDVYSECVYLHLKSLHILPVLILIPIIFIFSEIRLDRGIC